MSDEHLSGEEKRAKLKAQFKKDLLARQEFQDKVKHLRQSQRISDALASMSAQDDTDEWVNKLNEETAFMDAKTELAMDSMPTINVPIEGADGKVDLPELDNIASEKELQKIAAEELVRQMKAEMAAEQGESILSVPTPPVSANEPTTKRSALSIEAVELDSDTTTRMERPFRKMIDDMEE